VLFSPQPLALPPPQPVRFAKSPLALVACQVRFEHLGAPEEADLQALRGALGEEYPVLQQMQGLQIQIGPPGAQASTQQGWRFVSLGEDWIVSLLPDSASIETTAYQDWQDLDRRLRQMLGAIHAVLAPRVEVRLGLRYVNHLSRDDVAEPAGWAKYLRQELVALTASDPIAPSAFNAQQVIQLNAGDGAALTVRHGVPGGPGEWPENPVYLLDFDCYREGQRALQVEELLTEADRFNTMITSLFQWCITESLWKELDPHDK
jgi:uncharacterized protein (TIGR04255 family)